MIDPYRLRATHVHRCTFGIWPWTTDNETQVNTRLGCTSVEGQPWTKAMVGPRSEPIRDHVLHIHVHFDPIRKERGRRSSARQSRGGYLHLIQSKETVIQYPVLQSICGLLIKWSFFRPADALTPNHVDTIKLNLLVEGYRCHVYL